MKWQIPYQGRTWEFDDARLNGSEARLQKRLTDGLSPSQAGTARFELEIDAFVAALAIARRRAGLPIEEAVSIDVDDILLFGDELGIAEATEKAAKAAHTPVGGSPGDEIVRTGEADEEPSAEVAPKTRARKTA